MKSYRVTDYFCCQTSEISSSQIELLVPWTCPLYWHPPCQTAKTCKLLNSRQESCDGLHAVKSRVFAFGTEVFASEQCFSAQYVCNNFLLTNGCLRRLTIASP